MAEIVLGIATSHGPMLVTAPEQWQLRVAADRGASHYFRGRQMSFAELVTERRADGLADRVGLPLWKLQSQRCKSALGSLADAFAAARIDVAVIIGNDQREIFSDELQPSIAIFTGDAIVNAAWTEERLARLEPGLAEAVAGHTPAQGALYPGSPELGLYLVDALTQVQFDPTLIKSMPQQRTPHAYGFVYRQIMRDRPPPTVPVVLNTFYPPNQPTIQRCLSLGQTLARAILAWESTARVALVASGGLSHFVIDEQIDSVVLEGIRSGDLDPVMTLGEAAFQSGNSEIKNWLVVMAAMQAIHAKASIVDYVPCYRSTAGTGNAMGFVTWHL
jgi:3-O-methylgallate 3,4-dioxygenase